MELTTAFIQYSLHRIAYGLGTNDSALFRIIVVMIVGEGVITSEENELLVVAHIGPGVGSRAARRPTWRKRTQRPYWRPPTGLGTTEPADPSAQVPAEGTH